MKTLGVLTLALLTLGFSYKPGDKMAWDHSGLDTNGNPEVLDSAEVGLFIPGQTTPLNSVLGVPPDGTGWVLDPLTIGMPDGTFELRVRVQDEAGNQSAWSTDYLEMRIDKTPPAAPTGCRWFR